MTSQGFEFEAGGERSLQPQPIVLPESAGVGEQPAGDRSDRGWPDVRGTWFRSQGAQVVADGAVAAAVTALGDLLPQLPGIGAAVIPPLVEIRLERIELGRPVLPLAAEQFLRRIRFRELLDGAVGHTELTLDRDDQLSVCQQ
ncbi:hypothetical protein [Streptomyces sp. NPDC093598]|uniref:hypothetical protein n=1 Tax=Streptomyces sp. NPDC093598 TaxID=3366046 RepID=UPI0037F94A9D